MIELRMLGRLDLRDSEGREVGSILAPTKRIALLAYLAAATPRGFHRRDTLLALFWPELDQEHARRSLRQALYLIRRSMEDAVVVSRGDEEIGLDWDAFWCDAAAFDAMLDEGRAEDALEVYRGDLLEGFHLSGCGEFERWLADERSRLRKRAAQAAWSLAERDEQTGNVAQAGHWARHGVALSPGDETALRRLVELLDRLGDRAGAVREYEAFARRLAEEYDLEPSTETRELIEAVRSTKDIGGRAPPQPSSLPAQKAPEDSRSFKETLVSEREASVSVGVVMTPAQLRTAALVPRRRVLATRLAPVLVLGVVLLAAGAAVAWRTASGSSLDVERVLVDIFQNETGDPSLDPLGRMATDWITQGLTYTGFVDVVSVGTPLLSRQPVGFDTGVRFGPERLEAVAKAQGAGTVVWGRYYVQGDSVYFQPHVTDARNGEVLATIEPVRAAVDAPVHAMELLRDRVMTTLATLTDVRLAKWARYASKPPTFEAYKEFVEGVELHTTQMKFAEAIPHFLRAAALDSTFTMPLLWAIMAGAPAADSIAEALNRRREQLAPLDRHFLDYLLANRRLDAAGALRAMRRVVEIAPGSDYLKNAGAAALAVNRPREAIELLLEADPESGWLRGWFPYWNSLTVAYHVLGDHGKELAAARRGRRQFPNHISTLGHETRALAALGRTEEVEARVEESLHLEGRDAPVWFLAAQELYAHGQRSAASDILDRVIPWFEGKGSQRFNLAVALSWTGRLDESREILEGFELPSVSVEGFERPSEPVLTQLGVVAARQGDREEALRISRLLEERGRVFPTYRAGWGVWHYTYGPAQIAAALGERERAVELLRETIAGSGTFYSMQFHSNRNLESLWDYPPFRELLRPKG